MLYTCEFQKQILINLKQINSIKETLMTQDKDPSGLLIAALVTGTLGMSIVPVILGSIDLVRIKNGLESSKGKGFDIADIVFGALQIVFCITIILVVFMGLLLGLEGVTIFGIPIDSFI